MVRNFKLTNIVASFVVPHLGWSDKTDKILAAFPLFFIVSNVSSVLNKSTEILLAVYWKVISYDLKVIKC